MVEQDTSESEARDGSLYLVGVRLDPDRGDPDLYTLLLLYEGETIAKDRPLTHDGYIIWFVSRSQAASALLLGDAEFRKHMSAPDEVSAVYDFAQALWLVTGGTRDEGNEILDVTNFLLDLVDVSGFPFPEGYALLLSQFADHLTFDSDLERYLSPALRRKIMDALVWCIGAVTVKSKILR